MKKCRICKEEMPRSVYHKSKVNKDKLQNDCPTCRSVMAKMYRKKKGVEYDAWLNMKSRCYNKNKKGYEYWGGRGIKVCDRWINNYENFLSDMGVKPHSSYSLDRIDNEKDYYKENCRWATREQQNNNLRKPKAYSSNKSGFPGVSWNKRDGKWNVSIGHKGTRYNIGCFDDKEKAVEARRKAELKYWKD